MPFDPLFRAMLFHQTRSGGGYPLLCAQPSRVDIPEARRQGVRVIRRHKACLRLGDDVTHTPDLGRHDRHPRGHRLEQHHGGALRSRAEHPHVEGAEQVRGPFPAAMEMDVVCHSLLRDQRLESPPLETAADD